MSEELTEGELEAFERGSLIAEEDFRRLIAALREARAQRDEARGIVARLMEAEVIPTIRPEVVCSKPAEWHGLWDRRES